MDQKNTPTGSQGREAWMGNEPNENKSTEKAQGRHESTASKPSEKAGYTGTQPGSDTQHRGATQLGKTDQDTDEGVPNPGRDITTGGSGFDGTNRQVQGERDNDEKDAAELDDIDDDHIKDVRDEENTDGKESANDADTRRKREEQPTSMNK